MKRLATVFIGLSIGALTSVRANALYIEGSEPNQYNKPNQQAVAAAIPDADFQWKMAEITHPVTTIDGQNASRTMSVGELTASRTGTSDGVSAAIAGNLASQGISATVSGAADTSLCPQNYELHPYPPFYLPGWVGQVCVQTTYKTTYPSDQVVTVIPIYGDGSHTLFHTPSDGTVVWGETYQQVTNGDGSQVVYQNNFYHTYAEMLDALQALQAAGKNVTFSDGNLPVSSGNGFQIQFIQ